MTAMKNQFSRILRPLSALGLAFVVLGMNGCEGWVGSAKEAREQAQSRGPLKVVVLENPLVYHPESTGLASGLDSDLLRHFANFAGVKIKFVPVKTIEDAMNALRDGEGDMLAARLPASQQVREGFLPGPILEDTHMSLFCHRGVRVKSFTELANRRVLMKAQDRWTGLDSQLRQWVPEIDLKIEQTAGTPEIFRKLMNNQAECAILENLEGAWYARRHSLIEKVQPLGDDYSLNWLVRPEREDVSTLLGAWFQQASRDDEILRRQDRAMTPMTSLEKSDVLRFFKNLRERYPRFSKAFRESATEHSLDWRLLASVAYQESHWDSSARSYTGVKGIMQLTEDTAQHVGIEDRTDPIQSIWGGAWYLRSLYEKLPESMDDGDRWALALAAYNCGWAHLKGAQLLAKEKGLNPWAWPHIRRVLPLLENPEIAAELPAGRTARGTETVQFVERVRAFHSLWNLVD